MLFSTQFDVTELGVHDRANGSADGVISEISIEGTASWIIDGLDEVSLCNDSLNAGDTRVIGEVQEFFDSSRSRFYLFDVDTLETIVDTQGISENVVNVPEVAANDSFEIWTIRLGDQLSRGLEASRVSCAGDFDDDDVEDMALSITSIDEDYSRLKTSTMLVMSNDLATLDGLVDSENREVDLSLLRRTVDSD